MGLKPAISVVVSIFRMRIKTSSFTFLTHLLKKLKYDAIWSRRFSCLEGEKGRFDFLLQRFLVRHSFIKGRITFGKITGQGLVSRDWWIEYRVKTYFFSNNGHM